MLLAGHLPTAHFSLAEWSAMQVWEPEIPDSLAPDGWSRTRTENGRPICVFIPEPPVSLKMAFAVRPIVRVKMGRRVVTDSQETIYGWLSDRRRKARDRIEWKI